MQQSRSRRRFWTSVVLALLLLLIASSVTPPWWLDASRRRQSRIAATQSLVSAVAVTIAAYPADLVAREGAAHPFDANGDGYIDGRPATGVEPPERLRSLDDGELPTSRVGGRSQHRPFAAALVASGYGGFIAMAKPPLAKRFVDGRGRVIDAWQWPLHIAVASERYGAAGFGVWSDGPDGISGTADDITSWSNTPP